MACSSSDECADDPAISPETKLLRRIPPGRWRKDASDPRPDSDNFSIDQDGTGTSVDIWEGELPPEECLEGHEGFGLVSIKVEDVLNAGLTVRRIPIDGNDHHAEIQGKRNKRVKRKLAAASRWIKRPDD